MKLPLSWLKEFVALGAEVDEIAHRLSVAGLEVEAIERVRPAFEGVSVARIIEVKNHPNADRLHLCEVEDGVGNRLQIVCGAPNVRPGLMAPLAKVGARLQSGKKPGEAPALEAAVIRGVRSEGMLCSPRELGLSEDHAGILELEPEAPLGADLGHYLQLDDAVLDIAITPNRGDCLSILGLGRELAALFGQKLRAPRPARWKEALGEPAPAVEIHAPELCRRYAALRVDGVRVGPSPMWLKRRLELCGMRSINNLVDVTNYVMLELGQPLHAFDFDRLEGGAIVVRTAGEDARFVTLDGVERELAPGDLMICDLRRPVAIAGLMGGRDSEVGQDTTRLLLESAWFEPMTIARTGRRLGLRSEASYRFERGVDRALQAVALRRAGELIHKLCGARPVAPIRDLEPKPAPIREIEFSLERMAALLGIAIPPAEVKRRLSALGAKVTSAGQGKLRVQVPTFRPDLNESADLAEEVARLSGLEEIPPAPPLKPLGLTPVEPGRALTLRSRELMLGLGLTELRTIAFIAPEDNCRHPGLAGEGPIMVINPLSSELGELRASLMPGLLSALRFNLNRQATAFHAFEIGKVFFRDSEGAAEAMRLSGLGYGELVMAGLGRPPLMADFFTLKGQLESFFAALGLSGVEFTPLPAEAYRASALHPGKAAEIRLGGAGLGVIGELHPEAAMRLDLSAACVLFELDFDRLVASVGQKRAIETPPRFPAIRRDLALVVARELPAAAVIGALSNLKVNWLESVELFDVYTGEGIAPGKKSLALALRYRARERTLTDEEVNAAHQRLVELALKELGAEMRQ